VVLNPKKREAKKVGDFMPFSVLNASVKILSKMLANRLIGVLGEMIKDHQSSSLKSRSTLNFMAAAQEVIQFTKRNKILIFMLKLDF